MRRKLVAGIALFILTTLSLPVDAYAATPPPAPSSRSSQNGAITISPFLIEAQISPQDVSKDFQISLTNNTGKEQTFNISAVDVGSQNDTGGLAFVGGNIKNFSLKYGLAKWLHLPADTLTLAAGNSTIVTAGIANDEILGPGGHYAAIIISVINSSSPTNDNVRIQQKISALIFATKLGGEVYDMRLDKISHDGNWRHLPQLFTLDFQNKGNVHLVPRGTLKLLGPDGATISQGTINEASSYVLPETSRQMVVQTHTVGRAGWRPGTYRIQADYRYDGHPRFASRTTTFYFRNIPGLIAIIVACIIAVVAAWTGWVKRQRIVALTHKLFRVS